MLTVPRWPHYAVVMKYLFPWSQGLSLTAKRCSLAAVSAFLQNYPFGHVCLSIRNRKQMLIQGMVEMAPTISPLENISIAGHTLLSFSSCPRNSTKWLGAHTVSQEALSLTISAEVTLKFKYPFDSQIILRIFSNEKPWVSTRLICRTLWTKLPKFVVQICKTQTFQNNHGIAK